MLKRELGFRKIHHSILLFFSIFVLAGLVVSVSGAVFETYYASDYNILNGTYLSGGFSASLQTVDSDFFIVKSSSSATYASIYNPSTYNLFGSTSYVSGTTEDLVSDNGVYTVFRSYASATSTQDLYAHQETTTIGGNPYYLQELGSADAAGTNLSASMATTGRQLLGRFVYPLTGISSIPASTWTNFYRTWRDSDPSIAYDAVGSGNNGEGASNITWTHVVGSGTNRFIVIGISIRSITVSVLSVTVGEQSATFLRSDVRDTSIRGEIWYLISPDSDSQTVTVTLSADSKACGGSVSYTGVAQTSPIDVHEGVSYGGETPSVSLITTVDNGWIFSNLAISGTGTVIAYGSGQAHRYYQVGTGGGPSSRAGGDGDDKLTTIADSYNMSWTMSWWVDVVAQVVAFKPAPSPVGHVDVDILIRQSDGTVRTTIATNVANSEDLTSIPTTLSGVHSWTAYTAVNQTDYLEIDYYVEVTTAVSGTVAFLRIDDSALPTADQTRGTNIVLPSEYTTEVEFTGASNTYGWNQVVWTINSAWNTDAVTVTLQLYNYTLGAYPTSRNGFISYATSATANTDETKTQMITTGPQHFRDAAGNWKIKVKGVKTTPNQLDFKADWVMFTSNYWSEYTVSTEFLFSSMTSNASTQLNFTIVSQYNISSVNVTVQIWNYSSSTYTTSGEGHLAYTSIGSNETKTLSINTNPQFFTSNGNAKIKITGVLATQNQFQQEINQVIIKVSTQASSQSFDWFTTLLYVLPVVFVLPFLLVLKLKRKKTTKPHIGKKADAFSKSFGMTHQQMIGKKILLEVDPKSDYQNALFSFVSEARNSGETLFILTGMNSALHSAVSGTENVKFLLTSPKTSRIQQINETQTLLPATDLSVLLDAIVQHQKVETDKTSNMLFDNLSDIILTCGFEKTYKFMRFLLETISSPKTTALFMFNPAAHDSTISSSIRGLFQIHLAYTKRGPNVRTLF